MSEVEAILYCFCKLCISQNVFLSKYCKYVVMGCLILLNFGRFYLPGSFSLKLLR